MINQKVVEEIVRQAFALGVACRAPVGPAPVKATRRRDPERAVAVFDGVVDVALLRVLARHSYVNGDEREPPAARIQTVEALQRPAPDAAVAPFEQGRD